MSTPMPARPLLDEKDDEFTEEQREELERALEEADEDIRAGRVFSHDEVMRELERSTVRPARHC